MVRQDEELSSVQVLVKHFTTNTIANASLSSWAYIFSALCPVGHISSQPLTMYGTRRLFLSPICCDLAFGPTNNVVLMY